METLEPPKPIKTYDWRCKNPDCEALLRATKRDARSITVATAAHPIQKMEFLCPYCLWASLVEV